MNIIVKVGGVGTSVGKILGIYMNRRLLYLLEAVAGMSFLVLSGIFFQGNFFLKMLYAEKRKHISAVVVPYIIHFTYCIHDI